MDVEKNFFKEVNFAITVCDKNGEIIYMNDKSCQTFLKPGREVLIGKNVLDCHPEPAHSLLADMLQNPRTNAYTIEKNGIKKLIYQTPWYVEKEYMGFMELSLEIPFDMKHMVRSKG
jgi:transcriptional regulator with PAS, ATPase and Fis domain